MNLPSALIKQVLELGDFDTWGRVRKHYLPAEYHSLYDSIEKHVVKFHKLPKVEELTLAVRDSATLDKVYALKGIETDAEPFLLLEYLKNEYAQKEVLFQLDRYVENSIAFDSAEEVVSALQNISVELEKKVEIRPDEETMQKISLFDSEEEMDRRIVLGLNAEFDEKYQFSPTDYILMGGKRGAGKSITCSNLARHTVKDGKTAVYFSIEMQAREVLQRDVSIATAIPYDKIRKKNLNVIEWEIIAKFWASRYENGDTHLESYKEHRSFERFHARLSQEVLTGPQVDIVYDPSLTLTRIRNELDKRIALGIDIGVIIVDYINQVRLKADSYGMYDWKEQVEVSKGLKMIAQDYKIPVFSPYQIDATGEARFSKGILDSADAALVLTAHDECIEANITKMRNADDGESFCSVMNWSCLQIGPASATPPPPPEEEGKKKKQKIGGSKSVNPEIYDDTNSSYDPPF